MKLHFEPNLDYQRHAIDAVCDLFRGQEICRTEFTVTKSAAGGTFLPGMENDLGIGNRLTLLDDEILKNLHDVQLRHGLPPSAGLESGDFTVEMETGTGKTYVYLRTIFELNRSYGFTKFVIVVPSTNSKRGVVTAKVEIDVETAGGVRRLEKTVQDGDDLEQTTGRAIYANCRVGEIRAGRGNQFLELRVPGGEQFLKPGEAFGDVEPLAFQREMIRRTIKEHFDKELRLRPQGIKVLSLFFIDAVERYRKYDADGHAVKGDYALDFEEEYKRLAKHPDYRTLFSDVDLVAAAADVHDGYFSIDKKGGWSEPDLNAAGELSNQRSREDAERGYNLIMKDKEKLLSFETPLKFIFSHSALREGWDNPNVFQICALRNMGTERERRQTIGRGLRLCVNQQGERLRGFEVNTLTVVATEAYEQFAENLQKEIKQDTGIRFGIVEPHQFAGIATVGTDGAAKPLGFDQSKLLWEHLRQAGYVDARGKVRDKLKQALKEGTLELPEAFKAQKAQVQDILRKLSGKLDIKNADERRVVKTRQAVLNGEEFKALWDRIKHKTTYRVHFDNEALIATCTKAIHDAPPIAKTRLRWRNAALAIGRAGVEATETATSAPVVLDERDIDLPDILTDLQDKTQLTRRSIARILIDSGRLEDFKRNPQQFVELAAETINRTKRLAIIDGIKYQRLGDEYYYAQELFEQEELSGYLRNMVPAKRCVYEQVVYQRDVERNFAEQLEHNEAIKVYAKLPAWFKVPTPLGTYNPDWAVLVEVDGAQRLYFVVETKSSLYEDDLRHQEAAKIKCGEAHFNALATGVNPALFRKATSIDDLFR